NLTYANNELNTVGANNIRNIGLYMQGVNGATVSDNTVGNFSTVDAENKTGIWLASGTINATVSGNTISTLSYSGATAGFAPFGINITPTVASANINVTQNTITNLSTATTQAPPRGIGSIVAGTGGVIIQRNTVQGITNPNVGTWGVFGIDVSSGNNFTIKNNFVSDIKQDMTGGAAFSTSFGVFGIRIGSGHGHVLADNSVN